MSRKGTLEKDFFTKGTQSLTIKQLLLIPPEFRTYQHCKTIISHVKDVKFLERYMNTDEIYDLAKEFQLKTFETGAVVFRQGEPADAFYIIHSGAAKVFITIPSEVKHFSNLKEVMRLEKGDAFGELALLYDSVRSATIVTDEQTDLIVLDKESFRKHIKTISTSHLSQIMEFFKDFPAFQSLQVNEIARYASKCLVYRFPSNTVIMREGDMPNELFFIKSGRVKAIRRLNFKVHPYTKTLLVNDNSEPTADEIEREQYKSMLIEIDELSNGDSFCDYSILNKEPMSHSIVSAIPCELIALPLYDLAEMDEHTANEFKSFCKPYPDDSELRKIYLDLYRWNNWKKKLYTNVQIEKQNKRRGFNQQLREPFLKMVHMEKLTIPLDNKLDIDLLTGSKKKKGLNSTKAAITNGDIYDEEDVSGDQPSQKQSFINSSERHSKSGLLPKLVRGSHQRNTSESAANMTSIRETKGSESKLRKFEFIVPQHRLAKVEETEYIRNTTEEYTTTYDAMPINSEGYTTNKDVKAPYPFSVDQASNVNVKIPQMEDYSPTDDNAPGSVLGTRQIAKTFNKVMDQMAKDGFTLPSIRR